MDKGLYGAGDGARTRDLRLGKLSTSSALTHVNPPQVARYIGESGSAAEDQERQLPPNFTPLHEAVDEVIATPPADLQELAGMWDRLPEGVRAGMLVTARAVAGATGEPRA
jgi:hypothetical protein